MRLFRPFARRSTLVAALVLGAWIAALELAITGLVISNTLRGIEGVSALFIACLLCVVAYMALFVSGLREAIRRRSAAALAHWLAPRLLIVGLVFAAIAITALSVA